MFKTLAQEGPLPFSTKEQFFTKLLGIVSDASGQANPEHQYRQAYALKVAMWMQEETMGLEDAFKLATPVLVAYAD